MSLVRHDHGAAAAPAAGQPFAVLEERLHAAMTQQRRRMDQGDERLKAMRAAMERAEKEIVEGNADLARGEEHARMLDGSLAGLRIEKDKLAQAIEVVTERMQQDCELKAKREAARLEHVSQLNALTAQLAAAHDALIKQAGHQSAERDDNPKFNPTLAAELCADIEGLEAAFRTAKTSLSRPRDGAHDEQCEALEKVFIAYERFAHTSGFATMELAAADDDKVEPAEESTPSVGEQRAPSALDRLWEASPRALVL